MVESPYKHPFLEKAQQIMKFCANERCPFHNIVGDWHGHDRAYRPILSDCKPFLDSFDNIPTPMPVESRTNHRIVFPYTVKELYYCDVCYAVVEETIANLRYLIKEKFHIDI